MYLVLCCDVQAETFDGTGNPIIAIKGCRLSDWGGECAILRVSFIVAW